MFRYKIRKLVGEKAVREERSISLTEIADATGINRVSLSRMANNRGYNATLEVIGALCEYFGCGLDEVVEYVPDSTQGKPSPTRKKTVTKALAKTFKKAPHSAK